MQYLTIDYLIVYAFLAITLWIGLRAGGGIKDIREYAIANKSFGTGALVLTYLATNIAGASVLNGIAFMFSQGIIVFLALSGLIISYLIQAFFIVPKVASFRECLTMGDLVGTLYGKKSKIIAGVLGSLTAISLAGMELTLLGSVSESIIGIKAEWAIIFGGGLLAIYASYGGIKSVTVTDVFQFLVIIIVLPLIAYIVLHEAGGIKQVFTHIPADRFKVFTHPNFSLYFTMFLMWSFLPAGTIDPAIIQRWLMAKTGKQLHNQYLTIAAIDPAFQLILLIISFSALTLYPTLEANQVLPHVIQVLLPTGIKGLAMASLLAISMSSIDSYLHAAGLTFTHDVIQPFVGKRYPFHELRFIRYITLAISMIAIIVALYTTNSFELLLNSLAFTGPLLMFPLLSGIMGLKPDKQHFYWALIITLAVSVIAKFLLFPGQSHLVTLISILTNGIVFFGLHLIKYRGFAIVQREQQQLSKLWKPQSKAIIDIVKLIIPTPKRIIQYSRVKISQYSAPYILFGVFFVINYIAPYFMWAITPVEHGNVVNIVRLLGGVLCGLLIVQEKWPLSLKPYLPNFWHLTVLYCLPFTSAIMFLLTHGSMEWLVNIMGLIILLFILVDWLSGLIIGFLGIVLAVFFCKLFIKELNFHLDFTAIYLLIYQGIFGILIGLIFARRRQLRYDRLVADNQILTATEQEISQAHLETFKEKIRLIKTLKNADIQKLSTAVKELKFVRSQSASSVDAVDKTLQDIESSVASVALALTNVDHRAMDYLRLEIKSITIEQLLAQLQQQVSNSTLRYIEKTNNHQIICDPIQLIKVLRNTVAALPNNDNLSQQCYYLTIEDTHLMYPLPTVSPTGDYVKTIAAIRFIVSQQADQLPELVDSYMPALGSSALPNPTTGQELLLTDSQRIIKAHYGYTNVDVSKQADYEYYLYVLPVNVNDIRPADMNAPTMELGTELVRANDQYPGAQEQEKAFLAAVQEKTSANIENVKEALELIKWYHGAVSRRSGEPYYLHPLAVAQIVLDWNQEEATIIGALLHDIVEDTPMLLENIDMMFGPEVVRVVDYVTHFESFKDSFYRVKLTDSENMRMLLQATDKRALYVKIADRLHNMRTIEGHKTEEKKKKVSQETLGAVEKVVK